MTTIYHSQHREAFLRYFVEQWGVEWTGLDMIFVWPNVAESEACPRVEIMWTGAEDSAQTLKGGEFNRHEQEVLIRAVDGQSQGTEIVDLVANTLQTMFPPGLTFSALPARYGGYSFSLYFPEPVSIRPGLRDGSDWIVPVVIRYVAV